MRKIPSDMVAGTRHMTNNFGELEIVEYVDAKNTRVKFLATGYETIVRASDTREGRVKDRMHPSVCAVGFVSEGNFKTTIDGKDTKIYKTWRHMLERCYDKKYQAKRPTYIGCSVCAEWHNFQIFAEWMSEQDYEGKQLDKDIKVKGNKVYSPDTCTFVTLDKNVVDAHAKHYTFISPEGVVTDIYNLSEFCRDNELHQGHMSQVYIGKYRQHKGWTKA